MSLQSYSFRKSKQSVIQNNVPTYQWYTLVDITKENINFYIEEFQVHQVFQKCFL